MKEKIKIIVLIVIFILLLVAINKTLENQNPLSTNTVISENESYDEIIGTDGNVIDEESVSSSAVKKVTEANFDEEVLKSDKTVLVDFYADWCGPCKVLSPIVEEVANENPNLKVVKIDVDTNENLVYKYGTYSIPTLVVIKNGEETNRSTGVISKDAILELVK